MTESCKSNCSESYRDDLIYRASFVHFFFGVFSIGVRRVEGEFLFGEHLVEWAYRLQKFNRTATVSARFHLKTTIALAYLAWQLYRNNKQYNDWLYMAYKADLAGKQLKRLKRYIEANPYFSKFRSLTDAEGIIRMVDEYGREFIVEPAGILAFKRGQHPVGIICDDILKDPENRLNLAQIEKINRIFLEEVESMPKEELHLFGTPQDDRDLFGILKNVPEYEYREYPAITNWDDRVTLWTEKWDWKKLMEKKRIIGDKAFNKEFLCRPVRGEEGFFSIEQIDSAIDRSLKNYNIFKDEYDLDGDCFCGWDLGKKRHPSHFVVFRYDHKKDLLEQVHSKWFDGVDYNDQLAYVKMAMEYFGVLGGKYDNTRAELEGFAERGEVPEELEGEVLTGKFRWEVASVMDRLFSEGRVKLLNDSRQRGSLLSMDNDLNSPETKEGHGDAFWSIGLACKSFEDGAKEFIY